jgi:ATP-dependent DNA helicase 2 subunit 1
LLGFKPISALKPYHQITHSYFLFPDESRIEGSVALFSALLLQMHRKRQIAICTMQARLIGVPKLIALLPQVCCPICFYLVLADTLQLEEINPETGHQMAAPGINVIVLPWADDIRSPPETALVSGMIHW